MVGKKEVKTSFGGMFFEHLFRYWYLSFSLLIILVFFSFYMFLSLQFSVGEVVYKKADPYLIGTIKGLSLSEAGYVVFWNDGTYSSERFNDIGKIKEAPRLNNSKENPRNLTVSSQNKTSYNSGYGSKSGYSEFYNTSQQESEFQDYLIEKSSGQNVYGLFYRGTSLGVKLSEVKNCNPDFRCGAWSDCVVDYNLPDLINLTLPYGIQYRHCSDNSRCLPAITDSRPCSLKENLVVKKIMCNGEEIVFINNNGKVVARIDGMFNSNRLNINLNLIGEEECNLGEDY